MMVNALAEEVVSKRTGDWNHIAGTARINSGEDDRAIIMRNFSEGPHAMEKPS